MISKHILVIQTAFIGDAILAASVLETLHHSLPDARIDFLVRKGNDPLFQEHPFIDELLIWDKKNGKYANLWKLFRKIRGKRYDCVINLQRYAATGFLTAFSGATLKIGFEKNPLAFLFTHRFPHPFDGSHEIERNYQLLQPVTNGPLKNPVLYPTPQDFEAIKPYTGEKYICIAPASVWYTKQFPLGKWLDLIDELPSDIPIYILGAPGDASLADSLQNSQKNRRLLNLCGKLTLLQSAALMKGAVMNYVNDSAPMHLCSAVNAPVCAIYCSTVPAFGYGPLSSRSFIGQIRKPLPCRPCGLHGHKACPEGHFSCALEIDVRELAGYLHDSPNYLNESLGDS